VGNSSETPEGVRSQVFGNDQVADPIYLPGFSTGAWVEASDLALAQVIAGTFPRLRVTIVRGVLA